MVSHWGDCSLHRLAAETGYLMCIMDECAQNLQNVAFSFYIQLKICL